MIANCLASISEPGRALLALVSLICSSCVTMRVEAYASMLDCASHPGVVIWPIDASGDRYGYLVGTIYGDDATGEPVHPFEWTGELEGQLAEPLGSATVLLDPKPTADLRQRCGALLRELESRNPGMSTSVMVAPEPLGPIANGSELGSAIQRLYEAANDRRFREELHGVIRWDVDSYRPFYPSPDFIILPAADDATHFWVTGEGRRSILLSDENAAELPVHLLAKDDVRAHLAAIDSSWGWVAVPDDTPPESRDALS